MQPDVEAASIEKVTGLDGCPAGGAGRVGVPRPSLPQGRRGEGDRLGALVDGDRLLGWRRGRVGRVACLVGVEDAGARGAAERHEAARGLTVQPDVEAASIEKVTGLDDAPPVALAA